MKPEHNTIKRIEVTTQQNTVYASIYIQFPLDSLVCNNFLNPLSKSV
jgi:hypothetical protein